MMPFAIRSSVFACSGIITVGRRPLSSYSSADHALEAFDARIGNLADRSLECAANDVDTGLLPASIVALDLQRLRGHSRATPPPGTMPSSTAARVAFSASSTPSLRFFTLIFINPDLDHRNAAGELGQAFLQFLFVIVGRCVVDPLVLHPGDAALNILLLAGTWYLMVASSLVMVRRLALPSIRMVMFSSLMPRSSDSSAVSTAMSCNIALRLIAKARRLDRRDLQAAAQLVHDERGKCLAFDVLGDDEQRLARLYHQFEQGKSAVSPESFSR